VGFSMTIKLNSTNQIPKTISKRLRRFDTLFSKVATVDNLLKNSELHKIAEALDAICLKKGVIGYHFTRALREEIEKSGLIPCDGRKRRQKFLLQHGSRFTEEQFDWIKKSWDNYFTPSQSQPRNGRIWFNLTLDALKNAGADDLLAYFGGESIYMPLIDNAEIAAVLESIGQPLIVQCALEAEKLTTYCEIPWGKIWLSTYHLIVNHDASQFDQDASQEQPVPPSQIVSISPRDNFLIKLCEEGGQPLTQDINV